jgi:hypothetical protein
MRFLPQINTWLRNARLTGANSTSRTKSAAEHIGQAVDNIFRFDEHKRK